MKSRAAKLNDLAHATRQLIEARRRGEIGPSTYRSRRTVLRTRWRRLGEDPEAYLPLEPNDPHQADLEARRLVILDEHAEPRTPSTALAEALGIRHDNLLRRVDSLRASDVVNLLNIEEIGYIDGRGRPQRQLMLDERAALFLTPYLGGRKSQEIQLRLVDGYLMMRAELTRVGTERLSAARLANRSGGKASRRTLTDVIQKFVQYSVAQGSRNAHRYYTTITRLAYSIVLDLSDVSRIEGLREQMDSHQLALLAAVEEAVAAALEEGMRAELGYHSVFALANDRAGRIRSVMGIKPMRPALLLPPPVPETEGVEVPA